ncbi:hypothetical protein LC612_23815 [Nostoc sp. CHAB 5834]|nr:hypothetical protein [Nostoc sp. CHAB 5834]
MRLSTALCPLIQPVDKSAFVLGAFAFSALKSKGDRSGRLSSSLQWDRTKGESKTKRVTLFNGQGDRTRPPFPLRN